MGFCSSCIKYLMFIFNLLFVIIGLIILAIGGLCVSFVHTYVRGSAPDFQLLMVPILIIILGSIIFIVSFFGCCGAIRNDTCLIKTFAILMGILLIFTVGVLIFTLLFRGKVNEITVLVGKSMIEKYHEMEETVDMIQINFTCCGAQNYSDWDLVYGQQTSRQVPKSCCQQSGCQTTYTPPDKPTGIFTKGCVEVIDDVLSFYGMVVAVIIGGIILVQVIGIIFAIVLVRNVNKRYHPVRTLA